MEVREIMTNDPGTCSMDQSIREAAAMMIDCDCGAIPVVESPQTMRLMGIVTDRDLAIRAVAKGLDPNTTPVSECMSADISCVNPDSSVDDVERIMENLQVRRVPVVNENGSVVGMVSIADIAFARPKQKAAEIVQEVSKPSADAGHAPYLS